ncbi:vWA domain-containing protein [Kitasatospora phosalacinea]|uniref:vWA domain-containing protein n=1 Tax=Kitasatospora phosalacinea TaxID=2065 RepID=UPI000691FE40|nr:VWA-like domain-containing protein [Kitasatospora phosalacinea]
MSAPGAGPAAVRTPLRLDTGKLFAARLHAVRARPYLATALFAMHVVESRRVPTMAVDRYWRCYVSPGFVDRTPEEELASVWVHEVSHLLRDHARRGDLAMRALDLDGPADRLRVNLAADCEINDDAFGDGLVRPADAVYPATLGLAGDGLMEDYLRQFTIDTKYQRLVWLECGSGADGLEREWELGPDGARGLADHERDLVRFRVAQGILARPGDTPAGWRRWADEVFHPPQPWRRLLGAAIRSVVAAAGAGADYSYGRPARRSTSLPGVVLPSLRHRPPRVAVVVDTSGSVSDAELGTALLETAAILRAVGGRRELVSVLSCDAAARAVQQVADAGGLALVGGGGTDLRAGFAAALRRRPAPDVVVVLTDGQTPWPSAPPPCRTVVGLFPRRRVVDEDDPAYVPDDPPSWAKVVTLG